ncbi:MAG TPA: alpha/beta fold hydrolase [Actinomycetota bacterium]|nr:alpha/beta fold hydrolase [Actinomycetota bacterium]
MNREIPLYTLEGVKDAKITPYYFNTEDGLGLSMLRFQRGEASESVMIIHGLTTSTDMFIMPEHYNLVSYLLDHGYGDVWCLDFRMSNRHSYNLFKHRYTMDDVALYDYPPALDIMRKETGGNPIHVICHCLGANSFVMSLFGKAVDGVQSVIANSVGLTPRVPRWSRMKLAMAPNAVEYVLGFPYLNPNWCNDPGWTRGKGFSKVVSFFHRECDVPACHMLSLMWGTGWPALYSHDNLHDVTHRRGGDLYGATSMNYYRHVYKMVKAGHAVKYDTDAEHLKALPDDYFEHAADITTPVCWCTGADNKVFSDSNVVCYKRMEKVAPGRDELMILDGYGHQDPFMAKHSDRDVFPRFVDYMDRHRATPRAAEPVPVEAGSV